MKRVCKSRFLQRDIIKILVSYISNRRYQSNLNEKVLHGAIAISMLMALSFCSLPGEKKQKPNILFIMSDDHTSQAWGIYGGILKDYLKTPNISRLAEEGVVLDNCFCTNSLCTPSRASIVTGQFSHQNGVYTLDDSLNPFDVNVARLLQSNGFQTAVVGKWHLKSKPSGFDYFNVFPGHGQGRYNDPVLANSKNWDTGGEVYDGFCDDVISDQAVNWLKLREKGKPFFLMCHFKATHAPFDYPKRYEGLYDNDTIPEPGSLYDFGPEYNGRKIDLWGERWIEASKKQEGSFPGLPFYAEGLDSTQFREKVYQKFIKDYMRGVAAIDDNIGKLLGFLESEGLDKNTIVVYTADQGFFLGEHGLTDKRMMYEESIRMPFVIRYPAEVPAGKRIDDMILNIDFPSLFLDFAGIEQPGSMQGRSFRDNLKGNTPDNWRSSMYYRYWLHTPVYPANIGIRDKRYKLIFYYGQPLGMSGAETISTTPEWEFYDLKNDPYELQNAYNDPDYSQIIKELKKKLLNLRDEVGDTDSNYPQMNEIIDNYWEK